MAWGEEDEYGGPQEEAKKSHTHSDQCAAPCRIKSDEDFAYVKASFSHVLARARALSPSLSHTH